MNKKWTRPASALLTTVMLLTVLPETAFAPPADATEIMPDEIEENLPVENNGAEAALVGAQSNAGELTQLMYDAGAEDASISLREIDGEYYLFLPSSADLSEMVLRFSGDPVTMTAGDGSITVTSGEVFDLATLCSPAPDDGIYAITLSRGDATVTVKLMISANIGSMFLTSTDPVNKGRAYVEEVKGNKATGQMTLLGPGGEAVYNGELTQIKGRGNSTWNWAKKPYQIKLDKKTDLLENGEAAKTWVLLANYNDDAFLRNTLTFDLAAELGLPYSSGSRPVDLYYDGDYRGTYLLCEKTEIGSARVDIHDLEADFEDANPDVEDFDALPTAKGRNAFGGKYQYVTGLADPADLSGGYLLEMDFADRAAAEKSWFTTTHGSNIVSKSPEYLSQDAMDYISGFWQEFEDAVWNGGVNPDTGKSYTDYVDLDSLVRCYVIAELSQNGDAYRSSTFFYKPAGEEKLYAGPVWDFDAAYGKFLSIPSDTDLVALRTSIGHKLLAIPSFHEAVEKVYRNELHPLVTNVLLSAGAQTGRLRSLSAYQAEVAASQKMNGVLWPEASSQGFDNAVDELRAFLTRRSKLLSGLDWAALASLSGSLRFDDISRDDWFFPHVSYVADRGLLTGTRDNLFSPYVVLTRAMAVTMLHRLAGTPDASGSFTFDDVPSDRWYAGAVSWAAEVGIASGYSDGLFHPADEISRQEMAVFLYQYYTRYLGRDGAAAGLPDRFLDRDSVAGWAVDAMSWAVDQGILSGVSNTMLSPDSYTQRCMAAAMLERYCDLIGA